MPCEYVHVRRLQLTTVPPFRGGGTSVRRAVTAAMPDRPLLHNHADSPQVPLVRYASFSGQVEVVAIGPAVSLMLELAEGLEELRVGSDRFRVTGWEILDDRLPFGGCDQEHHYRFATSWIALNTENHRRFLGEPPASRGLLLERIMTGNLLSLSKAVGHHVQERLVPRMDRWQQVVCRHKGIELIGFKGEFRVNFRLMSGLGLGKLTAKGFGRVEALDDGGREDAECSSSS